MKTKHFAIGCVALLILVTFTYGQVMSIQVKVPFQFKVGSRTLPAGQYRVSEADTGPDMLKIENVNVPSIQAVEPVLTRISTQNPLTAGAVFDKLSASYILSEIWIPGSDGYLIRATAGKHEHVTVKSERAR